jgi:hypothetical protein
VTTLEACGMDKFIGRVDRIIDGTMEIAWVRAPDADRLGLPSFGMVADYPMGEFNLYLNGVQAMINALD